MIFERDVQENNIASDLGPAIPAHIQTEDHIPPVLEASSLAITDARLNPDDVEIIMHLSHMPAVAAVAGGTGVDVAPSISSLDDLVAPSHDFSHEFDDSASSYGALDTGDVRRLSFISFADVVHAEHIESGKDSAHHMSISSRTPSVSHRAPSPVRPPPLSPYSLRGSPPLSGETSPVRGTRIHSPPLTHGSSPHGELTIETMRQALRKTGSGDLGIRSQQTSAMTSDVGLAGRP